MFVLASQIPVISPKIPEPDVLGRPRSRSRLLLRPIGVGSTSSSRLKWVAPAANFFLLSSDKVTHLLEHNFLHNLNRLHANYKNKAFFFALLK